MRVRKVYKDCRVVVRQGGAVIAQRKMKKALPAEMIQIPVKAEKITGQEKLEVSVEC